MLRSLGRFDLDPCAAPNMPWKTADTMYALPQDGLALPWHGRVWLNPPYGREIDKWMAKLNRHGRGTALVFARTDTASFFSRIWDSAHALLFLRGRVFFHKGDGTQTRHSGGAPSVLAAFGQDDMYQLAESGLDGAFVPLPNGGQVLVVFEPNWLETATAAFAGPGDEKTLDEVYGLLSEHPKAKKNQHWRAKIRQQLQRSRFERVARGIYRLGSQN
jgi:hypothetical protein